MQPWLQQPSTATTAATHCATCTWVCQWSRTVAGTGRADPELHWSHYAVIATATRLILNLNRVHVLNDHKVFTVEVMRLWQQENKNATIVPTAEGQACWSYNPLTQLCTSSPP
jgi:hypothetical protein